MKGTLEVNKEATGIFLSTLRKFVNRQWKENNSNLERDFKTLNKSLNWFKQLVDDDPDKVEILKKISSWIRQNLYKPNPELKTHVLELSRELELGKKVSRPQKEKPNFFRIIKKPWNRFEPPSEN